MPKTIGLTAEQRLDNSLKDMHRRFNVVMASHHVKGTDFAKYLGVSQVTISNYRNGKTAIPLRAVMGLISYCNLDKDEIAQLMRVEG